MESKELLKEIALLRKTHIEMIDPLLGNNRTCGLASNYTELINRIADLLKISVLALEGMHVSSEVSLTEIEYNIADVIGIVIKLLPFSEMQFIDEVLEVLDKHSEA